MKTTLEDLPDEILLIVCEYLRQYYIINAFLNLNNRLNCMISQFLQSLVISGEYYSEREEGHQLLSTIGPHLHSLTVNRVHLSSSKISLASNIQELTFIQTQPDDLPPLENLTDLNIITGPTFNSIDVLFSNNQSLHSVYISSTSPLTIPIFSPPKISTIKQLALTLLSLDDFVHLLHICPELTCLNINLQKCNFTKTENLDTQSPIDTPSNLSIFSLRTISEINISFNQIQNVLKFIAPKLEFLAIEIFTEDIACVDGQSWENYIKEYLPHLHRFEFFIFIRRPFTKGLERLRLPNILQTFQSVFWSSVIPQDITGYYADCDSNSICIHTKISPTVRRRRYFLY